jgi:hypothetical protein
MSIIYLRMCVCVRVWVGMLARICVCGYPSASACVCASARVALLSRHVTRMRHIVSLVAPLIPQYLYTFSHKRRDFQKKKLLNIKRVFLFSLQLLFEVFFVLRRIQRDIVINVKTSSCKVPFILVGFY